MKSIEEAAREYFSNIEGAHNKFGIDQSWIDVFKAGVEFAQRWIPVEEELPEKNNNLIEDKEDEFDCVKTIKVLCLTDHGTITDNRRIKMQVGKHDWTWLMGYEGEKVTHWRLIELK